MRRNDFARRVGGFPCHRKWPNARTSNVFLKRKEVQMAGFRLLIDARASQPAAALGGALHIFQKTVPGGIHSVLVLAAKESSGNVEVLTGVQTETLPSIRALHKYVEPAQLTQIFAGSFLYSNEKWVRYRL
ncbi:pleckstrin homology domain-containing family G member 4B-like, partial [Chiloscyllium plagiosum]|uniref:pleckstrin homology domain-containing family G member 4B-like n=1 Tax=Chiloscyllium plagiosum TaxID=36176 RepID=UPI001CB7FA7D